MSDVYPTPTNLHPVNVATKIALAELLVCQILMDEEFDADDFGSAPTWNQIDRAVKFIGCKGSDFFSRFLDVSGDMYAADEVLTVPSLLDEADKVLDALN